MDDHRLENKQLILVGGCIDSKEFEDIAEIYDLIRAQNMNQERQLDDALLAQ